MPNHTHSDLERLKEIAKYKKATKPKTGDFTIDMRYMMFVLSEDEANVLEDVLLDLLSGEEVKLSKKDKKALLSVVKYIQQE